MLIFSRIEFDFTFMLRGDVFEKSIDFYRLDFWGSYNARKQQACCKLLRCSCKH